VDRRLGSIAVKTIVDRAEVSIDFPDKTYMGAFGRESSFDVKAEPDELLLRILRPGAERREVAFHLHYYLLGDILKEMGRGLAEHDFLDDAHLHSLREGVDALSKSLSKTRASRKGVKRK
jgi:hypothetical protein